MTKLFRKRELNFDFLKRDKFFYTLSILMLVVAVVSFVTRGMNYGIDFEGGVQIEATSSENITPTTLKSIRDQLDFLRGVSVQSAGEDGQRIIIQAQPDPEQNSAQLLTKIKDAMGPQYSYQSVEIIGPSIGNELKEKSLLASVLALLAIALYIWFRFEWPFAVGCLVALAHDLIIIVGVFSLFQIDFNMVVVAGLLALAGYDCNDSIVTYDRVRENLKKYRKMPVVELLNKSINETLSRTILTSLTTLFVVVILLVVGGDALFGFSLAMFLGTILGTYSSIYIAVPLLKYFDIRKLGDTSDATPDFNA